MKLQQYLDRLNQADGLIYRQATGRPRDFAQKLGISERYLYEFLEQMRDLGAEIAYCPRRQSYYYERAGRLRCVINFVPEAGK